MRWGRAAAAFASRSLRRHARCSARGTGLGARQGRVIATVFDYGNLHSLVKALELTPHASASRPMLRRCTDLLVLPGVGHSPTLPRYSPGARADAARHPERTATIGVCSACGCSSHQRGPGEGLGVFDGGDARRAHRTASGGTRSGRWRSGVGGFGTRDGVCRTALSAARETKRRHRVDDAGDRFPAACRRIDRRFQFPRKSSAG